MDTCGSLTEEITKFAEERSGEKYDGHLQKERVRITFNKDEYQSVFGQSNTETQLSNASYVSSRKIAEAELAAKKVEAQSIKEIQLQQAKLGQIRTDFKKKEATMQAELKMHQAQMQESLETERLKLKQMDADMEVKVAEARVKAYSESDDSLSDVNSCHLDPTASSFSPRAQVGRSLFADRVSPAANEALALTDALRDSLTLSRLPAPEPSVFIGDTLQYLRWKISFKNLIENKGLTSAERMYYLQRYLGGPALKVVEGFFFSTSEESYVSAWKLLEERYGHQFKIQEAFRDKLSKWPKISTKDASSLQEYADFLKACKEAMGQIAGLCILNDCKENQRLTNKLPDWAAARWNRVVTQALGGKGEYPQFATFVKFVADEARVACNPITSFGALRETEELTKVKDILKKEKRPNTRNKGTALATATKESTEENSTESSKNQTPKTCDFCKEPDHCLSTCTQFEEQSMSDRISFIQKSMLC